MASRSYTIGLPVVVTVDDDGTVKFCVDLSEAADDLYEGAATDATGRVTDSLDTIEEDEERVQAHLDARDDHCFGDVVHTAARVIACEAHPASCGKYEATPAHIAADADHAPAATPDDEGVVTNCDQCGMAVTWDARHHGFTR